jgi:hypothetical protein
MKNEYKFRLEGLAAVVFLFSTIMLFLAAWATHVIVCIKTSSWILLVFGVFVPPIGWLHGFANWFGLV